MSQNQVIKTEKPWGYELLWAQTDHYAGKILFIKEGHRLSLQLHEEKEETVFVLEGTLYLQIGEKTYRLLPGESYHIPPKTVHRMSARECNTKVAEVSTPQLADVVRLQDDYGRSR